MENVAQKNEKSIPGAIKIDEKEVFDHLDTLVRQSVEETINSLLDAEKAKVVVEFENFSFHPFQQQSSQRSENTGTSN